MSVVTILSGATSKLLRTIGPRRAIGLWRAFIQSVGGQWGFDPGSIASYDWSTHVAGVRLGTYHVSPCPAEAVPAYDEAYLIVKGAKYGISVLADKGQDVVEWYKTT